MLLNLCTDDQKVNHCNVIKPKYRRPEGHSLKKISATYKHVTENDQITYIEAMPQIKKDWCI